MGWRAIQETVLEFQPAAFIYGKEGAIEGIKSIHTLLPLKDRSI